MPDHRRFKAGIESDWPKCKNISGKDDDASKIPPANDPPYSDLSYLYGFGDEGNYSIINTEKNVGFSVKWDATVFKYLWYWQERYATMRMQLHWNRGHLCLILMQKKLLRKANGCQLSRMMW
jgi:hypothetical protein